MGNTKSNQKNQEYISEMNRIKVSERFRLNEKKN